MLTYRFEDYFLRFGAEFGHIAQYSQRHTTNNPNIFRVFGKKVAFWVVLWYAWGMPKQTTATNVFPGWVFGAEQAVETNDHDQSERFVDILTALNRQRKRSQRATNRDDRLT